MNNDIFKLCLVTDTSRYPLKQYLEFIRLAVKGGVTMVQLRDKHSSLNTIRTTARALKNVLSFLNIPLIINDYVQLAAEIDADGAHIGASDCSPVEARKILGPDKIIGYSIETLEQLNAANQLDCVNYLGASAIFPTTTKPDCKTVWGLEGLKWLSEQSQYPIIAIGGINFSNVRQVIEHGAIGVAVVGAIHQSLNPQLAAQQLIELIQRAKRCTI